MGKMLLGALDCKTILEYSTTWTGPRVLSIAQRNEQITETVVLGLYDLVVDAYNLSTQNAIAEKRGSI